MSPLADGSTLARLTRRDYAPIELTSVMFRPLGDQVATWRRVALTGA